MMFRGLSQNDSLEILAGWRQAIEENNVYGFGLSKMLHFRAPASRLWDETFHLQGIFDNKPSIWNQVILGFKIIQPEARRFEKVLASGGKVVIFSADRETIARQLTADGFKRNVDFVGVEDFWSLLCFFKYDQLYYQGVYGTLVTDHCNLRCRHCIGKFHLMGSRKGDLALESFQRDCDLFFDRVDFAYCVTLSGGEPLMAEELPAFLDIVGQYRHRIGVVNVNTNGMSKISRPVLARMKKYGFDLKISDYSEAGIAGYAEKKEALARQAEDFGLTPRLVKSPWFDYNLSEERKKKLAALGEDGLTRHFAACGKNCVFIVDGLLYPCAIQEWGDEYLADYIDLRTMNPLKKEDRLMLLLHFLGFFPRPYLKACQDCAGEGDPDFPPVPVAAGRQ